MSVARPRGPLPARVYWFRRLLLLGVVFGLVFGLSRVFGGSGAASPEPAARPASGVATADATPSATSTADAVPRTTNPAKKKTRIPLAVPTGPCQDSDVRIVPSLEESAFMGEDVRLTLRLSTFQSPACTWEVSPDNVAVKLTSGNDRIWSSQDCPTAVPTEDVVLRDRRATLVDVVWSGRRSDSDCSRLTDWAQAGYYHVTAAAMGSEPESEQFQLRSPAPITITPTPTPKPKGEAEPEASESPAGDD
ncbi:MAG TPA: hypothetical protein VFR87_00375 [Nocardioidaceae bacterium]|nr:hypothetical protein [Nocardioidaceae bacterium]